MSIRSVVCPTCNNTYKLPESKIPEKGARAVCKNCGGRIVIEGRKKDAPADSKAVPAPPAAPKTPPAPKAPPAPPPAKRAASPADPALLADYPDLQALSSPRIDLAQVFRPKKNGRYKSGLNNYKQKILKAVQVLAGKVLENDERVCRVGGGTAYYPAELFFGNGWLTMLYNRYALLCTDRRALLINVDHRMKRPTHYLFQVPYHNVKKVSLSSLFGRLTLKMKQGKNRTLTGIKRGAAKELARFFKEKMGDASTAAASGEVLENICPACFAPLGAGLLECTRCRQAFKEPKKAMLRSLLLPGLGDIYLGHRFLGILEMIGSILVWAFVIVGVLQGEYALLVLLVIVNGMDGLLTYHMAKKGYMPAQPVGAA